MHSIYSVFDLGERKIKLTMLSNYTLSLIRWELKKFPTEGKRREREVADLELRESETHGGSKESDAAGSTVAPEQPKRENRIVLWEDAFKK